MITSRAPHAAQAFREWARAQLRRGSRAWVTLKPKPGRGQGFAATGSSDASSSEAQVKYG